MADTDWLGLGATVLGGLLGGSSGSSGGTTTTSTNAADPRFNEYLYGTGGVLPSASNWYQNNSTGLNEQSLAGLNRQYSVASDPNTAQGYTNMQSLGSALMGGAVAGNPFTDGRMSLGSTSGLGQSLGATQQPTMGAMSFNNPANVSGSAAGSGAGAFTQPTYQTQNAGLPTQLSTLINSLGGSNLSNPYSGSSGSDGGMSGSSGTAGAIDGGSLSGMLGNLSGWASANPGTFSTLAGLVGGPVGGLMSKALLGILGTGADARSLGIGINDYGSIGDASVNSAIGTAMNSYGSGGWGGGGNSSSDNGGGDSSRGSQSDNGGRNGGDSGGF